jgi:cytochrome c-type biogenesis protein
MSDSTAQQERPTKTKGRRRTLSEKRWLLLLSFGVPAALVAIALILLLRVQNNAESAVANFATLLPVGYAFGAGMVASVNPCGFFMLPSYISYHLGTEDPDFYRASVASRLGKSFLLGGVATLGFVVIFALVGSVIAAGGQWLIRAFPYAGVAIGAVMVGLGLWLLVTHRTLGIMAASRVTLDRQRNLRNVFFFGIAYAIGSLSCTLPIFLVVVVGSLASQGVAASFGQFISYALGMGLILVAVTVGSALFQGSVARWLRRTIPYVHRASALFLVAAGAYLVYYWVFLVGLTF